jgi:5'-deoxynucleotidase YfbR-like HD superfamily hydrolase
MRNKEDKKRDWFPTYAGKRFSILNPRAQDIDIVDIAHALSMICRFNGHTNQFYSVAQHSVHVAQICRPEYALHGLLHDASEAYIGDVIRPLKRLLSNYREIEERIELAIAAHFGYNPYQHKRAVKIRDDTILCTEKRDVVSGRVNSMHFQKYKPVEFIIIPLPPNEAEAMFMRKFEELYAKHKTVSWEVSSR